MNKFIKFVCLNALLIGSASLAMDVDPSEHGWRLRSFAREGNIQQVQRFLDMGAPVDEKDDHNDIGWTALMHASSFGHHEVCKILINAKAQINFKDKNGITPLLDAAIRGHKEVCQVLIDAKADVNEKYQDKKYQDTFTALTCAGGWSHKEICLLLIDELIKPLKEKRAAAIALLGMKKFNRASCMRANNKNEIQTVAHLIFDPREIKDLFTQINSISNVQIKEELRTYALQQLKLATNGSSDHSDTSAQKKLKNSGTNKCTIA